MADVVTTTVPQSPIPAAPVKSPKKTKAAGTKKTKTGSKKSKMPTNHPQYIEMIRGAILALKEHKGSSRQAILKYIMANFNVGNDAKLVNSRIKLALKRGTKIGLYKQSKGTGAAGSFRLGEKKTTEAKKTKTVKAKKVTTVSASSDLSAPVKAKKSVKKAKSPKKVSPKKSMAKPKKALSPKKATTVKSAKKAKSAKPKSPKKAKAPKSPKKAKAPKKTVKKAAPAAVPHA